MSSAAHLTMDEDAPISRDDWLAFCREHDITRRVAAVMAEAHNYAEMVLGLDAEAARLRAQLRIAREVLALLARSAPAAADALARIDALEADHA